MLFSYHIKKQEHISILTMEGDLIEKSQADQMMQEINDIILNNNAWFIIDLSAMKYINSSGLTVLIQTLTKSRKAGGETVIANVGKRIKELLVITKLNTVFIVTDTVEEGLNKLNKLVSN